MPLNPQYILIRPLDIAKSRFEQLFRVEEHLVDRVRHYLSWIGC